MKYLVTVSFFLMLFIVPAMADPFIGSFAGELNDERYELSLTKSVGGHYQGTITVEGVHIQLAGQRDGDQLRGEFEEDGDVYEFTATVKDNGALYFVDEDGESILFEKANSTMTSNTIVTASERNVFVNSVRLDQEILEALEGSNQIPITDGRYWYDAHCGAWGVEGGPTAGFLMAGLPLPGPMPYGISGGGTGIVINGREIHPLDQQALFQLFGVTYQGEFWMDAQGSIGYVGGPAIANILQASQAKQSSGEGGGSATHGYDSTYGARGTSAGGMYSGRTATGKSVFWYPGM
jgi:hypothetical protein